MEGPQIVFCEAIMQLRSANPSPPGDHDRGKYQRTNSNPKPHRTMQAPVPDGLPTAERQYDNHYPKLINTLHQ